MGCSPASLSATSRSCRPAHRERLAQRLRRNADIATRRPSPDGRKHVMDPRWRTKAPPHDLLAHHYLALGLEKHPDIGKHVAEADIGELDPGPMRSARRKTPSAAGSLPQRRPHRAGPAAGGTDRSGL